MDVEIAEVRIEIFNLFDTQRSTFNVHAFDSSKGFPGLYFIEVPVLACSRVTQGGYRYIRYYGIPVQFEIV